MKIVKALSFSMLAVAGLTLPALAQDAAAPVKTESTAEAHKKGSDHRRDRGMHYKRMKRGAGPFMMMYRGVFDTDKDGKVTQAEIDEKMASLITTHDADKNEELSLDEFAALYAEVTRPMTVRAFQRLDKDGNGQIDKAEQDAFQAQLKKFTNDKED